MPENLIDMTPKGQLLGGLMPQAETEADAAAFRAFVDEITDEQAAQLLALDGFTEPYKIPIWDADLGGTAKDAGRKHDTPPDRYIDGQTAPRNVFDDIAGIIYGTSSLEEVLIRIEAAPHLNTISPQYWAKVGEILGKPKSLLPAVSGKRVKSLDYPLDKVNSSIWSLLEEDTNGQIKLAIKAESATSKKPVNIYYAVNFDDLGITTSKRLTAFDKRVYIAVAALYKAGNKIMTCSQIHQAMGYSTRPAKTDIEKIRTSVLKMSGTRVFLDNREEISKGGYNYPPVVIDGPLLPIFHRHDCVINGQTVPEAFAPVCDPPIVDFARARKQIIRVDRKLLETPISKTDQNLQIEDYLLERVARAKNQRQPPKILFSTLYEKAHVSTQKQQRRAVDKAQTIMQHYQKNGFIRAFNMEKDGISFEF